MDAIDFNAERILLGVIYHSFDSKQITSINTFSASKVLKQLRAKKIHFSIDRLDWRRLTDAERLSVLMNGSGIKRLIIDGEVTFYL